MPIDMAVKVDSRQFDLFRQLIAYFYRPAVFDLNAIEMSVRYGFRNNFLRQSVGGGAPWAALRPRTQRERRAAGYPPTMPILRRSGAYSRSWTVMGGWRMLVYSTAGWTLHVASDHAWAFAHELGDRSRNLPARPVRYLDDGSMRNIALTVERWVDRILTNFT